ncbi:MAG: glycosyltransferase family 2 protein [Butyribacter sp.]|nr:glycosyltransferase family 2 protein [bacterium]MDY3854545.1 glycosyltransferase family 2 protein [Butyribacter sp.]
MVSISLCMIVKNEEKVLARCLDSLAPVMDEIIIVDTGSTDSTKEIAKRYTSQVYDFAWTGSFADARNYAASKATKEYIYTADADEFVDRENQEKLLQLKSILLPEIEMVQMLYCTNGENNTVYNFEKEYRPKLYRRLRKFVWIDPIHETLRTDPVVYDSQIEIQHCPEGNHAKRDLEALCCAGMRKERFSKKLHHMYAMELYISGKEQDFVDAIPVFEKTLEEDGRSMEEVKEAMCVLARAYRIENNLPKFFGFALKDAVTASCAEICCELGKYYESEGDLAEAALWYQNAATETESILDIRTSQEIPREGLKRCGIETEDTHGE